MDSSNRACQIQGVSFSPKKSACGKLDSSTVLVCQGRPPGAGLAQAKLFRELQPCLVPPLGYKIDVATWKAYEWCTG